MRCWRPSPSLARRLPLSMIPSSRRPRLQNCLFPKRGTSPVSFSAQRTLLQTTGLAFLSTWQPCFQSTSDLSHWHHTQPSILPRTVLTQSAHPTGLTNSDVCREELEGLPSVLRYIARAHFSFEDLRGSTPLSTVQVADSECTVSWAISLLANH